MVGCSDGWVMGYDLRQTTSPLFSYRAHSSLSEIIVPTSPVVPKLCYVNEPYPSIFSCSLDGSLFQRTHTGEEREILCDRTCLASCSVESNMGIVGTGGQSGNLLVARYVLCVCCEERVAGKKHNC